MTTTIRNLLLLSILPLTLQSCISNADKASSTDNNKGSTNTGSSSTKETKDQAFIQKLADLQQRNPINDAQQAIANGDKRFIAKAGRGLNIPSISSTTYSSVKGRCGLRYEYGFGDVLYGENHSRYYGAFIRYAGLYNTTILSAC